MKNILLDMRLDKSSDDFIKVLRITQNDLANKKTNQLVKIYSDLCEVYDNEPTPFSDNQIRVTEAIASLASDIWITLSLRKHNVASLVDCIGDIQILNEDIMLHISNSQDIRAFLNDIGINEIPDDIGALYVTSIDGGITHMFSAFETIGYLSESLQALVINGEPTGNVDFYKQEQSENRQKVIEDTFERGNEDYEQ